MCCTHVSWRDGYTPSNQRCVRCCPLLFFCVCPYFCFGSDIIGHRRRRLLTVGMAWREVRCVYRPCTRYSLLSALHLPSTLHHNITFLTYSTRQESAHRECDFPPNNLITPFLSCVDTATSTTRAVNTQSVTRFPIVPKQSSLACPSGMFGPTRPCLQKPAY